MTGIRVLALEPYYGGSHQAFLDNWQRGSRHDWTILTLPARKWKWRMRHAAVTFAEQLSNQSSRRNWDVLLCSDMLNLAEFRGLAPSSVLDMPAVAYFHENQLTYPVRYEDKRDFQFAITNMTTALAANEVWFNSAFHRDSFLGALEDMLAKMPDHRPSAAVARIREKSSIWPQGIDEFPPRGERRQGPLRILWAARWEHDKAPEDFFEAVANLADRGLDFRLSVIGQQFREMPSVFKEAKEHFADRIDHWGYLPSRNDYMSVLSDADVIVSTARHEFFGVGVAEAIAAGALPLLPTRLAYPELLQLSACPQARTFFYESPSENLADRLSSLAELADRNTSIWPCNPNLARQIVSRFAWPTLTDQLDDALQQAANRR